MLRHRGIAAGRCSRTRTISSGNLERALFAGSRCVGCRSYAASTALHGSLTPNTRPHATGGAKNSSRRALKNTLPSSPAGLLQRGPRRGTVAQGLCGQAGARPIAGSWRWGNGDGLEQPLGVAGAARGLMGRALLLKELLRLVHAAMGGRASPGLATWTLPWGMREREPQRFRVQGANESSGGRDSGPRFARLQHVRLCPSIALHMCRAPVAAPVGLGVPLPAWYLLRPPDPSHAPPPPQPPHFDGRVRLPSRGSGLHTQ